MKEIEERIGPYRVHPVASLFPLLEGEDYNGLKSTIRGSGQQNPIIVQNGVLLDGRNRLRACLELDIVPRVQEYAGSIDVVDYIRITNLERRHLTEDMQVAIALKIFDWKVAQQNAARKAAQGPRGKEGGRGHKKTLDPNSGPGFKRDIAAKHARSTVGQIAAEAKVSRHKVAQAAQVKKHAPELFDKVQRGEMKLKDAAKTVEPPKPKTQHKPAAPQKPKHVKADDDEDNFSIERCASEFALARDAAFSRCPEPMQRELAVELLKRFMLVINLLLADDGWLLLNQTKQVILDLSVEHLAEVILKAFTSEQRAELRGKKW
jgi:ParB-like chromosome segregation protein Spo0J